MGYSVNNYMSGDDYRPQKIEPPMKQYQVPKKEITPWNAPDWMTAPLDTGPASMEDK